MTVLGGFGLLAVPILLFIGLISFFRKTGTAKRWFKISGGVFVAAVIILIFFSGDPDGTVEEASTEVKADSVRETEEIQEPKEEKTKLADSFITDLELITEDHLILSDESYNFIVENPLIFPALNDENITLAKSLADSSITAKHLNKNSQPYYQKIATFQGTVISVEEAPAEVSETISLTHVIDNEGQSYQVFMYKGTGEILQEDTVRFWGTPVGSSSFENISGGFTNVQVFLGSHMEISLN